MDCRHIDSLIFHSFQIKQLLPAPRLQDLAPQSDCKTSLDLGRRREWAGVILSSLNKFPCRGMGGGPNAKVAPPESRTPTRWSSAGCPTGRWYSPTQQGALRGHAGGGGGRRGRGFTEKGAGRGPEGCVCRTPASSSSSDLGKAQPAPAPGCYREGGRSRLNPYFGPSAPPHWRIFI